ncbi:MAG: hypothetical protein GYB41_01950 [Oceanospirillales bacterium]|nr:hypothetical protein [Oceanospirillales bacterium]
MANVEQSVALVDIIKAIGPYIVAVAGMAFGYVQSKKITEIAKKKDLEIANIQQRSIFQMEQLKNSNAALLKLQEIYSPMFAKVESIFHTYIGLVSDKKSPTNIKSDLEKFVADDYISFSVESRKAVLAEAIVICQVLQDHKAYEIAVNLDNKINEALSLVDFTGNSSGTEHTEVIKKIKREYGLLYVSLFYRAAELVKAANKSSNADAASSAGS